MGKQTPVEKPQDDKDTNVFDPRPVPIPTPEIVGANNLLLDSIRQLTAAVEGKEDRRFAQQRQTIANGATAIFDFKWRPQKWLIHFETGSTWSIEEGEYTGTQPAFSLYKNIVVTLPARQARLFITNTGGASGIVNVYALGDTVPFFANLAGANPNNPMSIVIGNSANNNQVPVINPPLTFGQTNAIPVAAITNLWDGTAFESLRTPFVFKTVVAVAVVAGTGATIWTPAGGKKVRLMGYSLSASAAASLIFGDNAIATVIYRGPLLAIAGIDQPPPFGNGMLLAAANNVLKLDVSANATITGTVWGTEE